MFCELCGNRMERQKDGSLACRLGHTLKDEGTRIRIREKVKKVEKRRKKLLTFPETYRVIVLRIMIPKHRKPFTPACDKTPSFHIYKEFDRMEEEYGSRRFRRIRGNLWVKDSHGYILCDRTLKFQVMGRTENLLMADGSNFWLEEVDYSDDEKKQLIEEEKARITRELFEDD